MFMPCRVEGVNGRPRCVAALVPSATSADVRNPWVQTLVLTWADSKHSRVKTLALPSVESWHSRAQMLVFLSVLTWVYA